MTTSRRCWVANKELFAWDVFIRWQLSMYWIFGWLGDICWPESILGGVRRVSGGRLGGVWISSKGLLTFFYFFILPKNQSWPRQKYLGFGCQGTVWRVSGGVWRVLDSVSGILYTAQIFFFFNVKSTLSKILTFGVSGGCLEGIWGCLECVWRVSKGFCILSSV